MIPQRFPQFLKDGKMYHGVMMLALVGSLKISISLLIVKIQANVKQAVNDILLTTLKQVIAF